LEVYFFFGVFFAFGLAAAFFLGDLAFLGLAGAFFKQKSRSSWDYFQIVIRSVYIILRKDY
jgi:hypothetical protein